MTITKGGKPMIGLTKLAMVRLAARLAPVCLLVGCGTTNAVAVDGATTPACTPPVVVAATPKPATVQSKPTPKPTAKATTTKKTTTSKPTAKPTAKPSTKPTSETPAAATDDAETFATKVLTHLADAPGYDAVVLKEERALSGGNYVYNNKLRIIGKKGGRVKLDVMQHYKPANVGVKLGWQLGSGTVTVRPAGALSFLTKDFPATDKQIISPNGIRPDFCELYNIADRLRGATYSFELIGKTSVGGSEVYMLKASSSATNAMDSNIQYEYIGFDPSSFEIKLWECYGGPDLSTPVHRVTLESFKIRDDITDAELKV